MRARPPHGSRSLLAQRLRRPAHVLLAVFATYLPACAELAPRPSAGTFTPATGLFERPWRWTDEHGNDVLFSHWRGAALIVTTVYTSCTERCPLTVEKLRRVDDALGHRNIDHHVVLVTLDPEHDTLDRLRHFKAARNIPASWRLLRGDRDETRELARMLQVRAIYDDGHIDHDVRVALFDEQGRLIKNFAGWDFDENGPLFAR